MTQKIAVAIIHGIGKQDRTFAQKITDALNVRCRDVCGEDVIIESVHWAPVLQAEEDELQLRLEQGGRMNFPRLRGFAIDFVADALAYQPAPDDRAAYDGIHRVFAQAIHRLAEQAGPTAPLCIIAHSLGSIIASNYLYDLQIEPFRPIISGIVKECIGDTPVEHGETLALLYTLGSPIALWSLRYRNFGKPIQVPAPQLEQYYPSLRGEWVNFYDRDDVVGFPIKTLNEKYREVVTEDREVNSGRMLVDLTPLSHMGYWTDRDIVGPIADALNRVWETINPSL
jgi:hypothetical protein